MIESDVRVIEFFENLGVSWFRRGKWSKRSIPGSMRTSIKTYNL